jgi:hypothetical protein
MLFVQAQVVDDGSVKTKAGVAESLRRARLRQQTVAAVVQDDSGEVHSLLLADRHNYIDISQQTLHSLNYWAS